MVSNSNILDLFEFLPLPIHFNFTTNIPITPDLGMTNSLAICYSQSFQTISSSDLQSCLHLWDTFLSNGKKVMETSLKRSRSWALYLANSDTIQCNCRFRIAEASEKFFELLENTWVVYSIWTINTNKVCPATSYVTAIKIQSEDTIKIRPRCYIRNMDQVISADK